MAYGLEASDVPVKIIPKIRRCLKPKSRSNNCPKTLEIATEAVILHIFEASGMCIQLMKDVTRQEKSKRDADSGFKAQGLGGA